MSAIPIHRVDQLEFRAEWITTDFVSFHINYWQPDNTSCFTIAIIKGCFTAEFIVDRAFRPTIDPVALHSVLAHAFTFIASIPTPTPVIYHLQQLYPEYFI